MFRVQGLVSVQGLGQNLLLVAPCLFAEPREEEPSDKEENDKGGTSCHDDECIGICTNMCMDIYGHGAKTHL